MILLLVFFQIMFPVLTIEYHRRVSEYSRPTPNGHAAPWSVHAMLCEHLRFHSSTNPVCICDPQGEDMLGESAMTFCEQVHEIRLARVGRFLSVF